MALSLSLYVYIYTFTWGKHLKIGRTPFLWLLGGPRYLNNMINRGDKHIIASLLRHS
jgi:hypothetical protein